MGRWTVNVAMRQFSDVELIPNLSFQWEFDLFCDVKKSLVSIECDHQMAIMLVAYQKNWPPKNWWFDSMMVQSVFHFEELAHPFLDSSARTNWSIVRHSIHPLRIKCMVYFFHVKQIEPKTKIYISFHQFEFVSFLCAVHWTNSAATLLSEWQSKDKLKCLIRKQTLCSFVLAKSK